MLLAVIPLVPIVILMVFMGYFMLGSLPLLTLKHDTPLDAQFVRNFFFHYYRLVLVMAIVSAITFALTGHPGFSAGMVVLSIVVFMARRFVIPQMDALREEMRPEDSDRIARFRRLHVGGMALNILQLAAVGMSLMVLKL